MKTNIFYADSDTLARMACLKAKSIGHSKYLILNASTHEFQELFVNLVQPDLATATKQEMNVYHFRLKAAKDMMHLSDALKNIGKTVKTEVKVTKGGCS